MAIDPPLPPARQADLISALRSLREGEPRRERDAQQPRQPDATWPFADSHAEAAFPAQNSGGGGGCSSYKPPQSPTPGGFMSSSALRTPSPSAARQGGHVTFDPTATPVPATPELGGGNRSAGGIKEQPSPSFSRGKNGSMVRGRRGVTPVEMMQRLQQDGQLGRSPSDHPNTSLSLYRKQQQGEGRQPSPPKPAPIAFGGGGEALRAPPGLAADRPPPTSAGAPGAAPGSWAPPASMTPRQTPLAAGMMGSRDERAMAGSPSRGGFGSAPLVAQPSGPIAAQPAASSSANPWETQGIKPTGADFTQKMEAAAGGAPELTGLPPGGASLFATASAAAVPPGTSALTGAGSTGFDAKPAAGAGIFGGNSGTGVFGSSGGGGQFGAGTGGNAFATQPATPAPGPALFGAKQGAAATSAPAFGFGGAAATSAPAFGVGGAAATSAPAFGFGASGFGASTASGGSASLNFSTFGTPSAAQPSPGLGGFTTRSPG